MVASKATDIKSVTLQMLEQVSSQYPQGSRENKAYGQVLEAARKLTIVSLADLDQLDALFEKALQVMLTSSSSVEGITFNGIVWLEDQR